METVASKREILRTIHRDWDADIDERNKFTYCTTIDPKQVTHAWDCLSMDTFEVEIATYPAMLHQVLINTLLKRSTRGR